MPHGFHFLAAITVASSGSVRRDTNRYGGYRPIWDRYNTRIFDTILAAYLLDYLAVDVKRMVTNEFRKKAEGILSIHRARIRALLPQRRFKNQSQ